MNDGLFYTVEEAAEKLQVNPETIRRRIRKGKLKAQLIDGDRGKQYSIPANELFIEEAVLLPEQKLAQPILDQIAAANAKAVQEVIAAQFALQEEKTAQLVSTMAAEIQSLKSEIQALKEANANTIGLLTAPKEKLPFWKKWFS